MMQELAMLFGSLDVLSGTLLEAIALSRLCSEAFIQMCKGECV